MPYPSSEMTSTVMGNCTSVWTLAVTMCVPSSLIGSASSGGFAELHYSDGAGGFAGSQIVPLPVGPRAVGVGDFNSDGIADLVAVDYEDSTDMVVLLGEGDQNFAEPEVVPFPTWAHDLAVADVNDDGVDDVVVYGAEIGVLRSTL